ncbi:MAG: RTX toxin, partial [Myxococcales bacterium]
MRCWGDNRGPLLGYGTGATLRSPAELGPVELGGKAVQVTTRGDHACARLDTGVVRCWGVGLRGQLGHGNKDDIGDNETAASAGDVPVGGKATQVSGGDEYTCAVLDSGHVRCWGNGLSGQLGHSKPSIIGDDEPASAAGDVPVEGKVTQVSASAGHTCALLDSGNIRCWGNNLYGQLGYGDTQNRSASSAADVPVGGKVLQVTAGYYFTCALLDSGNVRCWGNNSYAQLGQYNNATVIGDNEPASAAGDVPVGGKVIQISAGEEHVCALLDSGNVRCWGAGYSGALGHGNKQNVGWGEPPEKVGDVPIGGKVVQISAGKGHTCALLDSGKV